MATYTNATDSPTFQSFVFDVSTQSPQLIGPSLSADDNSVVMVTTGGTIGDKSVAGYLFNPVTPLTNQLVTLSAGTNLFKVDKAYNGSSMAVYFTDRSTTLFTVATATGAQTLGDNGFIARGPEEIRKRLLGYI